MTTLIFCSSEADFHRAALGILGKVVIISQEVRVHDVFSGRFDCYFPDQLFPRTRIVHEVNQIVELISQTLIGRMGHIVADNELQWIRFVDGADPQIVQNMLLYWTSISDLFTQLNPTEVISAGIADPDWKESVLELLCDRFHVPYSLKTDSFSRRMAYRNQFKRCAFVILGIKFNGYIPKRWLAFAKRTLFVIYLFRMWVKMLKGVKKVGVKPARSILFLVGNYGNQHFRWNLPMYECVNRSGFESVVCSWRSPEMTDRLRSIGIISENLECYVSLRNLGQAYQKIGQIKFLFEQAKSDIAAEIEISEFVGLGRLLLPFLYEFIGYELFTRLLMTRALDNYFSDYCPIAVRPWEFHAPLGRIFLQKLSRGDFWASKKRPLIFMYQTGLWFNDCHHTRHEKSTEALDVVFVMGDYDYSDYVQDFGEERVRISGYFSPSRFYPNSSLNITKHQRPPGSSPLKILYVGSNCAEGIFSVTESNLIYKSLIKFAAIHFSSVEFVLKLHPAEPADIVRFCWEACGAPSNVTIVSNQPVESVLGVCDVVLLKISTVALDAMELEIPVISIVLDREPDYLNLYHNGVEKVTRLPDLEAMLAQFVESPETFKSWSDGRILEQAKFLEKKIPKLPKPPQNVVMNEIIQRISDAA